MCRFRSGISFLFIRRSWYETNCASVGDFAVSDLRIRLLLLQKLVWLVVCHGPRAGVFRSAHLLRSGNDHSRTDDGASASVHGAGSLAALLPMPLHLPAMSD
jgi:hypothetical protein